MTLLVSSSTQEAATDDKAVVFPHDISSAHGVAEESLLHLDAFDLAKSEHDAMTLLVSSSTQEAATDDKAVVISQDISSAHGVAEETVLRLDAVDLAKSER